MNFHYLDIVFLVLILALSYRGWVKGFVREIFELIGVALGFVLASRFAPNIGQLAGEYVAITNNGARWLVGFVLLLVVIFLVFWLLGIVLSRFLHKKNGGIIRKTMQILNRLGGVLFSAIKIFVVVSVIFFALSQTRAIGGWLEEKLDTSLAYSAFKSVGGALIKLDMEEKVDAFKEQISQEVNSAVDIAKEAAEEQARQAGESVDQAQTNAQEVVRDIAQEAVKDLAVQDLIDDLATGLNNTVEEAVDDGE